MADVPVTTGILAGDVFVYGSDTKSSVYFVKVDKNGN